MLRALLLATVASAALGACTQYSAAPYGSANNPPGWIDRNRDGVDDRVAGSPTNPNNPPGWIDQNRNGVDDRVERRRSEGYYDQYGVWRTS